MGDLLPLSDTDIARISDVLLAAWSDGTIETYGSGVLSYHVYCDSKHVLESQRAPASPTLIAGYLSTMAGIVSGGTLANYVAGVRAWHIIHGARWAMEKAELDALLKAADALTPPSSKRKPRLPYTPEILCLLRPHFNLDIPLDASIWSNITTLFYSTSRGGEFTVKNLTAFNPAIHVKRSDVTDVVDRNGLRLKDFFLPRTKSAAHGEHVNWAKQNGPSDPEAALANHFRVNDPPRNGALFAYRHGAGHRPLTRAALDKRLKQAFKDAGLDPLLIHGIRIGSTVEYLLRGVPIDVMKIKGRWASDSFERYLRKHAEIMAPYMQAQPELHEAVLRIMMPRMRR
ncbi:hypothetical protein DFH06DRAFT_1044561 [Mycena polygramma]|nr:hypothetical protein DFH06DRAFT_1044561 [Mycena polygramma]